MEPDEYIEYFEDTILIRTPTSGKKGSYAKVSLSDSSRVFVVVSIIMP